MANLVNLEAVGVVVGHRDLLSGISLGVQSGDRIGVLGLNGSGKSTLLSVLAGTRPPEAGRVAIGRGVRVAVVAQHTELEPGRTVRDVALGSFGGSDDADHHWASDSSVRGVLDGLGLAGIGLETLVDNLSGGERRRVSLAAALVTDADLLILDEPTNHLDIEGVAWLADHLIARRGALVVVTHDRWFLDAVATLTWEVADAEVFIREGGYSDWVFARAERLRLASAAEERRKNLARKELAWLRRGAPARTSKPRYRIEAAEALIADVPDPRDTVALHAFARRRLGRDVLDAEGVTASVPAPSVAASVPAPSVAASVPAPDVAASVPAPNVAAAAAGAGARPGADRVLLDDVTWRIGAGDRLGIVGVNGSGKSTLLKVLLGEHPLLAGKVKRGKTVNLGYLSQDVTELPGRLRLLEAVTEVARVVDIGGKDVTAGQLCERFGFGTLQQWTFVDELSGGERRRLQLLRILMSEPNVLVLDEPTNDLDTDTLQSLEDLLDSWPGTLIVVSHDRYLIERICDDVVALLGDGKITQMVGGVPEYLERRAVARRQPVAAAAPVGGQSKAAAGGRSSATSVGVAVDIRQLRKDLQRLEKRLESLDRRERDLHQSLADVGTDYGRAAELNGLLTAVLADKETVELEWMALAEQMEAS